MRRRSPLVGRAEKQPQESISPRRSANGRRPLRAALTCLRHRACCFSLEESNRRKGFSWSSTLSKMSGDHRKGRTDQLRPKEVMTLADLSSRRTLRRDAPRMPALGGVAGSRARSWSSRDLRWIDVSCVRGDRGGRWAGFGRPNRGCARRTAPIPRQAGTPGERRPRFTRERSLVQSQVRPFKSPARPAFCWPGRHRVRGRARSVRDLLTDSSVGARSRKR
jgi:hypothetical protein